MFLQQTYFDSWPNTNVPVNLSECSAVTCVLRKTRHCSETAVTNYFTVLTENGKSVPWFNFGLHRLCILARYYKFSSICFRNLKVISSMKEYILNS